MTSLHPNTFTHAKTLDLIAAEVTRQDLMWGTSNERAAVSSNQLHDAALAQLIALGMKQSGDEEAFTLNEGFCGLHIYPKDWSGFRDYGSDIANLVVAAAYIHQEIKRKLAAGEDTTRASRNVETDPYGETANPAVIEP